LFQYLLISIKEQLLCSASTYGSWFFLADFPLKIMYKYSSIIYCWCTFCCHCVFLSETSASCWWSLCSCSHQPMFRCIEIQCLCHARSAWKCLICGPVPEVCGVV